MKVEKQVLHHCFAKAKEFRKLGDNDKARDYLDFGIARVAHMKEDGYDGEDLVEGVKVNLWLDRFWQKLENWDLLL